MRIQRITIEGEKEEVLVMTMRLVRTCCIFFKFDLVLTFSFALAFVYNAFHSPVVKLGGRECDKFDIWVIWVTGKNL